MRRQRTFFMVLSLALLLALPAAVQADHGPESDSRGKVRTHLRNTGLDADARGRVDFRWNDNRQRYHFRLKVKNLELGDYDVLMDDDVMGTVTVVPDDDGTGTRGVMRLRVRGEGPPFDPRGHEISVAQGSEVFLEGELPESRAEMRRRVRFRMSLDNVSTEQPDARAETRFRSDRGRERFRVSLRGAEPGTYELFVGAESRGTFEVDGTGEGHIKFDTVAHSPGDDWELMTFDPLGQDLEVHSATETVFQGTMPSRS